MKKYSPKYLPFIIGVACAIGVIIGSFLNFSPLDHNVFSANPSKQKLGRLIDYINYHYVDEVNTDSIVDATITDILRSLDPHSVYIPESHIEMVNRNMEGSFVGIGVQFYMLHDTVAVIRTIQGGPSAKAGIRPGDRLLYAEGTPLFGQAMTADSLKEILGGKINSQIHLKVWRPGQSKRIEKELTRARIPLKSVVATFMLNDRLGYIKINRFSERTYEEFEKAISTLEEKGATEIVLDLRNNGGGYVGEAIKVADEFLKAGKLIVFTKNRRGDVKKTFATHKGDFEAAKVYVLINQNTASASEIVAGALQDNDVGTIVGRRSFGKGLVQREMSFADGSVVRLTVARYYTPTGRSIQKPYKGESTAAYYHDHFERYINGELVNEDSIPVRDSLKFTTPEGKVVYGGGGISPDVFVPEDISYKKESLDFMLRRGVMDRFVFTLMDKNRAYYNNLSREEFKEQVQITNAMVQGFTDYLDSKFKLHYKVSKYREVLKEYLKAVMARQLFSENAFYYILSQKDPIIQKVRALDSLRH